MWVVVCFTAAWPRRWVAAVVAAPAPHAVRRKVAPRMRAVRMTLVLDMWSLLGAGPLFRCARVGMRSLYHKEMVKSR
ncbi:hypothetical protein D3C87_1948190 [compost metagenome]